MSDQALTTEQLGKKYGRTCALRDCTFTLPTGRVAALVGPNGAGKTTLLHLAVGLLTPTAGTVNIFGLSPSHQPAAVLPRVGFVAQDHPLYRGFTVAETLLLGKKLNAHWDNAYAMSRLASLHIPLDRQVGQLSGGQQAQVALALALAKRPQLLLLDEPVASLDPLARRDFLRTLMDGVAGGDLTVMLSSHIIGDLERVCDYLIILAAARVVLAGDIEELLNEHKLLTGPRDHVAAVANVHTIIDASLTDRQATLLVRAKGPVFDQAWQVSSVSLEDIVLAYLSQSEALAAGDISTPTAVPAEVRQ